MVSWEIRLHPEDEAWYLAICGSDPETGDLIEDAIDQLVHEGPTAGRPLVDRVKSSRFQNMKELRPPSAGQSEIRMLFGFDPAREAIFWWQATSPVGGRVGTGRLFRWRTSGLRNT
jgi:hypothetical protein